VTQRLSYNDSCRALQNQQIIEAGDIPPLPPKSPRHDDDALGINFFRTLLADAKMEHLTLPRTFFGRSEIRGTSFKDTDLSESTINWNDFIDVDFSSADLSRCDFRGCQLQDVSFCGTRLTNADFRHCSFESCDFKDADFAGTKLTRKAAVSLRLSPEQKQVIDWQADDGEEPEGG
jgi:uncharacterized protein YjbI with pentapeptide repeats